jgi:hypothetical protein
MTSAVYHFSFKGGVQGQSYRLDINQPQFSFQTNKNILGGA